MTWKSMTKAIKLLAGSLSVFICTPIWYVLLYNLLKAINADRLMWFLFWVYLPVGFLVSIIGVFIKAVLEDGND